MRSHEVLLAGGEKTDQPAEDYHPPAHEENPWHDRCSQVPDIGVDADQARGEDDEDTNPGGKEAPLTGRSGGFHAGLHPGGVSRGQEDTAACRPQSRASEASGLPTVRLSPFKHGMTTNQSPESAQVNLHPINRACELEFIMNHENQSSQPRINLISLCRYRDILHELLKGLCIIY